MRMDRLRARRKVQAGAIVFGLLIGAAVGLTTRAVATPRAHFSIGFTVMMPEATNVAIHWRVWCTKDGATKERRGQTRAITPFTRSVKQTIEDADSCHLRVVAWDVPPRVGGHPLVRTWVL